MFPDNYLRNVLIRMQCPWERVISQDSLQSQASFALLCTHQCVEINMPTEMVHEILALQLK